MVDGLAYKHLGNSNSIVYGITRAGKTTGFVLPTIYSNATAKDKPCFILTDKKDELYQKTCNFLTKQGYRI
ncbi:MAG: type IV secretory system conjugative DNA transfer family protein [Mycoplasmoidaceae bacterium]|nr:type IV secretory system conjugative DNA transfer family protein [Mycoplasmoidaceae bacterium]